MVNSYAFEQFDEAVSVMAVSHAPIHQRLFWAFSDLLDLIDAGDLPLECREEWRQLKRQVTRGVGADRRDKLERTLQQMSLAEAAGVAERIVRIHHMIGAIGMQYSRAA